MNQNTADRERLRWLDERKNEKRELVNRGKDLLMVKEARLNERKKKLKALLDTEY